LELIFAKYVDKLIKVWMEVWRMGGQLGIIEVRWRVCGKIEGSLRADEGSLKKSGFGRKQRIPFRLKKC
jgi:hypothetical protein